MRLQFQPSAFTYHLLSILGKAGKGFSCEALPPASLCSPPHHSAPSPRAAPIAPQSPAAGAVPPRVLSLPFLFPYPTATSPLEDVPPGMGLAPPRSDPCKELSPCSGPPLHLRASLPFPAGRAPFPSLQARHAFSSLLEAPRLHPLEMGSLPLSPRPGACGWH